LTDTNFGQAEYQANKRCLHVRVYVALAPDMPKWPKCFPQWPKRVDLNIPPAHSICPSSLLSYRWHSYGVRGIQRTHLKKKGSRGINPSLSEAIDQNVG